MSNCKNCFSPIADQRKATRCATCNSALHKECAINDGGTFCDGCYTERTSAPQISYKIPETIRRSNIELYKRCPYAFYMQVVKGYESPPTAYTQLGVILHELFDYASNHVGFNADWMKNNFFTQWDDWEKDSELFPSEEFKEKMRKRAIDSIDTFYTILPTLPAKPFCTEEKIDFSIGDELPNVNITMDRIDEVDGMLEILDWKTGAVMVGQKLSSDLQAPLYLYAVQQKYNRPIRKFTFYYLHENKVRVFERISDDIYECIVNKRRYLISLSDAIKEVQSLFGRIKRGDFNIPRDVKKMHFTCKMCHLQVEGKCRGAYEESWHINQNGGWGE